MAGRVRRLRGVVSVGTGSVTPLPQAPSGVVQWARALFELSLSPSLTNAIAGGLLGAGGGTGGGGGDGSSTRFFRFDIPCGRALELTKVRLEALAAMLAAGRRYVARCAAEGAFTRLAAELGVAGAPAGGGCRGRGSCAARHGRSRARR